MNNRTIYIYRYFLIFCIAFSSKVSLSQSQILKFDNISLRQVIETLEQESEYIFNYDPSLLNEYFFSGNVDTNDFIDDMESILYQSPYTYQLKDNTILVYQEDQKTYRICGVVKDAQTNETLIGTNINAVQNTAGSQSDFQGSFDFQLTVVKNQKIEISYLGYTTITFMVQDIESKDCPIYYMKVDEGLMDGEIIIKDYILDGIIEGNEFGGLGLDFDQLSKNHSTVEHDILKTAQLLPGINSIDDSATNLQIRGSGPDQNLILWEGAPIYSAGHIFGMISAINPFSVDQVSIYKGAHDPRYDNRVGGIVDISLTDSIENDFHGSLGTTMTELHTNLDIPIIDDHLSISVAGRKSIDEIYNSPPLQSYTQKVFQYSIIDDQIEDAQGGSINTEQTLNYNDWNAKILLQPSDRISITTGIYSNHQDFKYLFSFPDDPFLSTDKIEVNTKAINTEINFDISDKWTSIFSFYNSSYNNEYNNEETENGLVIGSNIQSNKIKDESFTLTNNFRLTKSANIKVGYEHNTKEVYLDLGDESVFKPEFDSQSTEIASFHNLFSSITYAYKKIKIDAGNRSSYYDESNKWFHSPRVNFQYSINDEWKIKADGGLYHQFISQLNDFGANQITIDNPFWVLNTLEDQLTQKANKIAIGFVFRKNGWLLDADGYYNKNEGLSSVSPVLSTLSGDHAISKGSSISRGIDLLLKKKWSSFNTWINYSLRRAENTFPDILEKAFLAPNDIRHNLSIVASYKIKSFQFSLNGNYHSGLPYSRPILVKNTEEENLIPPFNYYQEYRSYNNYRLKPYMRFDLNINYRPVFKRLSNLRSEISLTLVNILNQKNEVAQEYFLDYEEGATKPKLPFIRKTLLGRTPLLLFRLYW